MLFASASRVIAVASETLGLNILQAGKVALDFCAANACASVLQGAERIQRWYRRRILAMWANTFVM